MRLGYFIPTYNQLDWIIEKHLPSLDHTLFSHIRVHHNFLEDARTLSRIDKDTITVPFFFTYSDENLGVARTWNLFAEFAKLEELDVMFIANDDIILFENTIPNMIDKLNETNLNGIVCYGGNNGFSLFAIPMSVFNTVGKFDENFYPAYFEDNDYVFRMRLHKLPVYYLESPGYYHKGSATINSFDEERMQNHHANFRRNEQYYINKWGGPPGKETIPVHT